MRALAALGVVAALALSSASASAGKVTVEQHGGRDVRVFVPTTAATPTSLVVLLHGCTQSAIEFEEATQMDAIAEKAGFVVAYPEQSPDTVATRCYRWYEPAHQARGAGEPKELSDAAGAIATGHGVDPERVYVAGLSAGAAMSVILGATYPDRFAAIGAVAGVEYKAATSLSEFYAVSSGGGPSPETQGDLAFTQMGTRARAVPTFVVHGAADGVLAVINGDQVAAQWLRTNTRALGDGAIEPAAITTGNAGYSFTRTVHAATNGGASVVEYYRVDGLGHAWPGGKDGGSYSDPEGPNASALLWAFFEGRTLSAPLDVPPPAAPGSGGAPDGSGGATSADPADANANGAPPSSSGSSSSSGGGCSATRDGAHANGLGALSLLAIAAAIAARRSRRASR